MKRKPDNKSVSGGGRRRRKRTGINHLVAATNYSLSGVEMASHETAIHHEVVLGVIHFVAVLIIPFDFSIRLVLSLAWFLVIVTEMMNTALEAVVDIASPERQPLAKRAKDVASAAVFTAIVCFGSGWGLALLHLIYFKFFA